MNPSAEPLLRPLLAFLTLCVAAFLLAPTVASVHDSITDMHVEREFSWHIFKFSRPPPPDLPFPNCGGSDRDLFSEITQWPKSIQKDQPFALRGRVTSVQDGNLGVGSIDVDVFLNETKEKPGIFLGAIETDSAGVFALGSSVPFDLQAAHYHIVAHAKQKRISCTLYREHWSDPEIDILSRTHIAWDEPDHIVVGRAVNITGKLLDSVDGPVRNATVNLTLVGAKNVTTITTDDEGSFGLMYTPGKAGNVSLAVEYRGSRYYNATRGEITWPVADEDFELDPNPVTVIRSSPTTLTGHVYVADAARTKEITLALDGFRATACAGCPASSTLTVPLDVDGGFTLTLTVPANETAGAHTMRASGGGLKRAYAVNVTLDVPTTLTVASGGTSLFGHGYTARATLTDEIGRPLGGSTIAFFGPDGWRTSAADPNGTLMVSGSGACGATPLHAYFNGTDHVRSSEGQTDAFLCGFLAFIPPWLLAVPWWVWPLAALGALAAWQIVRGMRQKYSPIITGGPALTLLFTEPADDAAGYAAIGEAVVATAFLEDPLPDGHRLRMGTHTATSETPLDAELRAHLHLVPDRLGDVRIRAEVLDAKGRVVSRRTATLHVVRYAQEIERRYLALRSQTGASDAVTPREFERWLHERAPGLDGEVARRLVRVFEEADYSPRTAGRADFSAYLAAETGVQEVSARAQ